MKTGHTSSGKPTIATSSSPGLEECQAPLNDPSASLTASAAFDGSGKQSAHWWNCQAIHTSALLLALAHGNLVKIIAEARDEWKGQARLTVDNL